MSKAVSQAGGGGKDMSFKMLDASFAWSVTQSRKHTSANSPGILSTVMASQNILPQLERRVNEFKPAS